MSGREFCLRCDSILPLEITGTAVICRLCHLAHSYTDLLNKEIHSTVIFNTTDIAEEVGLQCFKYFPALHQNVYLTDFFDQTGKWGPISFEAIILKHNTYICYLVFVRSIQVQ